ncbi:5-methylthioadenosine/S-adenosylhomocysteine deaminase [Leucobacter luti]|uniref:amidohydrolase n=1 Tax=Leucobacter luti TaxID=340320 RepID=UPI00104758F7|nr:amidohydrolase [Leucobacter luti]MCW2289901.1 5-methylthioadenosine/S-adenosylhomocysteine deaminase [Leucobacter luti]TCK36071.1 5-methylthioadenosine/S-adenosylhomocysteine deaminase [Leucobacter luti]
MTENVTVLRAEAMLTPTGTVAPAELEIDATGRISYAGTPRAAADRPAGARVRELVGQVLMPGLVNGHTHSAMTLLRAVSDDEGFMPWLAAVQALEQHLTHDDVVAGLQLALVEMIETGTTSFADMYHWDAELIEVVRAAGMRAMIAPASFSAEIVGFPGVSPANGAAVTALTEQLAEQYAADPQIRIAFGPHAPYTSPPEFLSDITERAVARGIPIHTHISESAAEVAQIQERYGATPAAHLDRIGLFAADVLAAHCVHLTPSEIELFARAGAAISHNPVSNLKLGNGIAPLPAWQAAGIRLTLGTDSVASNNTLDLFEEIKTATILHRGAHQDAAIVRASDVLDIATRRGAEAIGFSETGALEAGMQADVIALDITGSAATPFDPAALVSHLGFAATGADVRHVFIGGRHVYADGAHLTLDAPAVRARAAAVRMRLAALAATPA